VVICNKVELKCGKNKSRVSVSRPLGMEFLIQIEPRLSTSYGFYAKRCTSPLDLRLLGENMQR
jgi:hypothetical protein